MTKIYTYYKPAFLVFTKSAPPSWITQRPGEMRKTEKETNNQTNSQKKK
jgi:hypothetical protein